jgi:hypothetical protein
MKRLILLSALVFLSALMAYSQEADSLSLYKKAGTGIKYDGVKLSTSSRDSLLSDVGGVNFNAEWNKYSKEHGWGIGLISAGGAIFGVSVGMAYVFLMCDVVVLGLTLGTADASMLKNAGWSLFGGGGLGLVTAGVGIYLLCNSNAHLRKIVDTVNVDRQFPAKTQLSLGLQQHGIGFAMNF